jgi:cytochrome c-type biogenesis protein CcmH/NrfF
MSDDLYITCECGYEIQVSPDALGTTLECINCGLDVEISEEAARRHRTIHQPGVGTQRNTSRDSLDPEEEPSIPLAPFDPTAPVASASAFEEPEDDSDVFGTHDPWKPEGAPARSPFEDESETDEPIVSEPQPTAPSPRIFTEVTEQGAHREVGEEEKCPRCGNPYRGDWDKQITEDGELCYICSNQATDKIPERLRDGPRNIEENIPPPHGVVIQSEAGSSFWLLDPQSEGFRRMLWVLAVGTILLAVVLNYTDDYEPPNVRDAYITEAEAPAVDEAPPPELPGWANAIYWTWQVVAGMGGIFLTLYLALAFRGRLPHETIKGNVVVLGVTTLALSGVGFVLGAAYWWFGGSPLLILIVMIGSVFSVFSTIIILMRLLDFNIRDFIAAFLLFGFSQSVIQAIGMFIMWGLAAVAL